jgi:hypothetical protein
VIPPVRHDAAGRETFETVVGKFIDAVLRTLVIQRSLFALLSISVKRYDLHQKFNNALTRKPLQFCKQVIQLKHQAKTS